MYTDKRCERIVFSKEDYENDKDKLFEEVSKQIRILLDAGYITVVRYDEPGLGIVVIEFEHDEHNTPWGVCNPFWLTDDEVFYAYSKSNEQEEESLNE